MVFSEAGPCGCHFNATVCIPDDASCYMVNICVGIRRQSRRWNFSSINPLPHHHEQSTQDFKRPFLGSYGLGIQLLDAQTVSGRITDRESSPVTGAAVVLQTPDSIFVGAAVSDANGHFTLSAQPEQYRLIVQHLLYRSRTVNGTGKDVGTIVLQPADRTIGEVVIKSRAPHSKSGRGEVEL